MVSELWRLHANLLSDDIQPDRTKMMLARTVARSVSVVILLSASLPAKEFIHKLADWREFSISTILLLCLYFAPLILIAIGAASLFTRKRFGYLLVYVGFILSIFGFSWLYVPFIELSFQSVYLNIATSLFVNGVVVAILAWCHVQEKQHESEPRIG